MLNLNLELTNAEAAALYVVAAEQREALAALIARPADPQTETRCVAYNVLGRIMAVLLQHAGVVSAVQPRLVRCKKCGWVAGTGHAVGCPAAV